MLVLPLQTAFSGFLACYVIFLLLLLKARQYISDNNAVHQELMLSNCDAGEDSQKPLGKQGDQTSQS